MNDDMFGLSQDDKAKALNIMSRTMVVVYTVNLALGTRLSAAALHNETTHLVTLQSLALMYAEETLPKVDWIRLSRQAARLATTEAMASAWRWRDTDLMMFALADYLEQQTDAGDALLRAVVQVGCQGEDRHEDGAYRQTGRNLYDKLRAALAEDGELHDLSEAIVARRGKPDAI